jgi:hypothetical protein
MGAFDSLAVDVKALVAELGAAFTVRRYAGGAPADAAKPWRPGAAVLATYTGTGVLDQRRRATGEIVDVVYVAASGATFTPALTDIIRIGGLDRQVIEIETISPDGLNLLWVLSLRTPADLTMVP